MQARPLETLTMLFRSLCHYLKWSSRREREDHSRRRRGSPRRAGRAHRCVPRLEALEDRTVLSTLTVTSAADDGSAGTLRAGLAGAQSGDTIRFLDQLKGQTITLMQGQLLVNQSLDIDGLGATKLTISGNAASRIFDVGSGARVTIFGLTLTGG
jgi:hypothetical protein